MTELIVPSSVTLGEALGDTVQAGPLASGTSAARSYTKMQEFTLTRDMPAGVRVKWSDYSSGGAGYSEIYINGTASGGGGENTTTSYKAYSYDTPALVKGDTVELWGYAQSTGTFYYENFELCEDFTLVDLGGYPLITALPVNVAIT